jgi:hypothetical protein
VVVGWDCLGRIETCKDRNLIMTTVEPCPIRQVSSPTPPINNITGFIAAILRSALLRQIPLYKHNIITLGLGLRLQSLNSTMADKKSRYVGTPREQKSSSPLTSPSSPPQQHPRTDNHPNPAAQQHKRTRAGFPPPPSSTMSATTSPRAQTWNPPCSASRR